MGFSAYSTLSSYKDAKNNNTNCINSIFFLIESINQLRVVFLKIGIINKYMEI